MSTTLRSVVIFAIAFGLAAASFAQTPPFTRTIIVNNTGAPTTDGAALLSALSSLSPAPSYTNRWVIKLEGGVYAVGPTPVVVPSYVNLEGSGSDLTIVQGSVGPPPGFLTGGLVQANSFSEIRDLRINCFSQTGVQEACQALSADGTNPRLSHLFISVNGTGTGTHWGIRVLNGKPIIDEITVAVAAGDSAESYGIVFDGTSALSILRSDVRARDASDRNWAIVIKGNLESSFASESNFLGIGGDNAAGVAYLHSSTSQYLQLDNCKVQGISATTVNRGIHEEDSFGGQPKIVIRGGVVYSHGDGIVQPLASVYVLNSEVQVVGSGTGSANLCSTLGPDSICARDVSVASSLLANGTVTGIVFERCAGVVDAAYTFLPSTCP